MVKLNVRGEVKETNKSLELYLEKYGDDVVLRVLDDDGEDWGIFAIKDNGQLELYSGLQNDIGLDVDKDGRIKGYEEGK